MHTLTFLFKYKRLTEPNVNAIAVQPSPESEVKF